MSYINIDERINATEREMRQEDPELVATFERLGVFEPADDADRRLLLMASTFVFTVAIATMSPVAWVLSALAVYAWKKVEEVAMAAMETLSEAIRRLTDAAYVHDFRADGEQLVCDRCGARFDPSMMTINEIVRFEGMSDPDDQAILYALGDGSGSLGLYSAAYGAAASTDDIAVARALPNHRSPPVDLAKCL